MFRFVNIYRAWYHSKYILKFERIKSATLKKLFEIASFLAIIVTIPVTGQDINPLIKKEAAASVAGAEAMYRDLHQNPELSLQEFRTAGKMAEVLKTLGFEVITGVGGNGVVGVFKNGSGPVVMLRTDMDALPVLEKTDLSYASTVVMQELNEDQMPEITVAGDYTPPVVNDADLVTGVTASMSRAIVDLFQRK